MKRFIFVAAILLNVVKGKIESEDSEVLFLFRLQLTYGFLKLLRYWKNFCEKEEKIDISSFS